MVTSGRFWSISAYVCRFLPISADFGPKSAQNRSEIGRNRSKSVEIVQNRSEIAVALQRLLKPISSIFHIPKLIFLAQHVAHLEVKSLTCFCKSASGDQQPSQDLPRPPKPPPAPLRNSSQAPPSLSKTPPEHHFKLKFGKICTIFSNSDSTT